MDSCTPASQHMNMPRPRACCSSKAKQGQQYRGSGSCGRSCGGHSSPMQADAHVQVVHKGWHNNFLVAIAIEVGDQRGGIDAGGHLTHPAQVHVLGTGAGGGLVLPAGGPPSSLSAAKRAHHSQSHSIAHSAWTQALAFECWHMTAHRRFLSSWYALLCRNLLPFADVRWESDATGLVSWAHT